MGFEAIGRSEHRHFMVTPANDDQLRIRWGLMAAALLVTTIVPLAIHAHMIDVGIPHPGPLPIWSITRGIDDLCIAVGALLLLGLPGPRLEGRPVALRAFILFVLIAGMGGRVFRDPFMDMMNTAAPAVSVSTAGYLFDDALGLLPLALIMALAAALRGIVPSSMRRIGGVLALGSAIALVAWFASAWADQACAGIDAWFDARAPRIIEQPPYDARIMIPAYATFVENAMCTILLVAVVWRRLPQPPLARVGAATGLVLLVLGPVARPFIDGVAASDHWLGFMSSGQFLLETLALGILAGVACLLALRPR